MLFVFITVAHEGLILINFCCISLVYVYVIWYQIFICFLIFIGLTPFDLFMAAILQLYMHLDFVIIGLLLLLGSWVLRLALLLNGLSLYFLCFIQIVRTKRFCCYLTSFVVGFMGAFMVSEWAECLFLVFFSFQVLYLLVLSPKDSFSFIGAKRMALSIVAAVL
jgi:hypothetical protein